MSDPSPNDFEKAAEGKQPGLGRELLDLLRNHKRWWLLPILIALALVGALIILATTKAAPFIYSFF
jgi:hypothetical protein